MKKNVTKILTIVALAIFAALAIAAIVLAVIKKDFNQVINSDVNAVTVYQGTASNTYFKNADDEESKTVFNNVMNKYYAGTKESLLSSMFQGAFSKAAQPEVVKTGATALSTILTSETYNIRFHFANEQTLKINNEVYIDSKLTSQDKTVKYSSVILTVEKNNTLNKISMYVVNDSNSSYTYYTVKFATHHQALYDYIADLEFPG